MNVRAPVAAAPISAASAECSDSTLMNLASSVPSAQNLLRSLTICVCGVIGGFDLTA